MMTNLDSIKFKLTSEDEALFDTGQIDELRKIETLYSSLKDYCFESVEILQTGTHKEWMKSRIDLYITTSIMRLLYLVESFQDAVEKFNLVAAAIHIKAMVEIPFHLGYLLWIVSEKHSFEEVREELAKISWGHKKPDEPFTSAAKITQKKFYTNADKMLKKLFNETPETINVMETIYKEANAAGHHNYEGRNLLSGIQHGTVWNIRDRKEWFVFISQKIIPFLLHAKVIMTTSETFIKAIYHYVNQLPDFLPETKNDVKTNSENTNTDRQ